MVRLRLRCALLALCSLVLLFCIPVGADDTAVSVAAGGIQLRKEARISMEKERLFISEDKVIVDFDFLNETDKDITTDVAFPVPPYTFSFETPPGSDFASFKCWVDGKQISYDTEAHAILNGTDYSDLLRSMGVDPATFGEYDWKKGPPDGSPQISRLSPSARARIIQLGLIDKDELPNWIVRKMYYWRQTFPAHKLVHIRHEYTPVIGHEPVQLRNFHREFPHACIDPNTEAALRADVPFIDKQQGPYVYHGDWFGATWVNYILTTANTWKTPISDFELIVEKPQPINHHNWHTSFCWEGPVQRLDSRRFVARKSNFIPTKELAVYFFIKDDVE